MGQVLAAYSLDRKLLKKMEESNAAEFQYPTTDWRYTLRHCFFHTKIVLTIGAATILLFHIAAPLRDKFPYQGQAGVIRKKPLDIPRFGS